MCGRGWGRRWVLLNGPNFPELSGLSWLQVPISTWSTCRGGWTTWWLVYLTSSQVMLYLLMDERCNIIVGWPKYIVRADGHLFGFIWKIQRKVLGNRAHKACRWSGPQNILSPTSIVPLIGCVHATVLPEDVAFAKGQDFDEGQPEQEIVMTTSSQVRVSTDRRKYLWSSARIH